jgi:hypothetical protein
MKSESDFDVFIAITARDGRFIDDEGKAAQLSSHDMICPWKRAHFLVALSDCHDFYQFLSRLDSAGRFMHFVADPGQLMVSGQSSPREGGES